MTKQAMLTVDRPSSSEYDTKHKTISAGTVVEIVGQSNKTQRYFAKTENWSLCFMPSEAVIINNNS